MLKRTQKGSEGESTGSGLSAMNDMCSANIRLPRIHSLLWDKSRRSFQTEKEDVHEEAADEAVGPETLVLEAAGNSAR